MLMIRKANYKLETIFIVLSCLWIILSSNTLVFCILNMEMSMIVLLALSLVLLWINGGRIKRENLYILVMLLSLVMVNVLLNFKYTTFDKNIIILLMRLVSIMIMASVINRDDFMIYYVAIMIYISVISIISNIIVNITGTLPLVNSTTHNGKYYIYTFYYTLGRWNIWDRNAGPFWEPGGFQIFLNFALIMMFTKTKHFVGKWGMRKFILGVITLATTILTTRSSTGYMCMGLVLAIGVLSREGSKKTRRLLLSLIAVAVIAFLFIETRYGIVGDKVINKAYSYNTRYDDVVYTFKLGLSRIIGYGFANTYSSVVLPPSVVASGSCGLGYFMIEFGPPLTLVYLMYIFFRSKNFFSFNYLQAYIYFIFFLMCVMSENVYPITMFLVFLFKWKGESVVVPLKENDNERSL